MARHESSASPYYTSQAARLDERLNASREHQGLSWPAFARKADISEQGLRDIRYGLRTPRQSTIEAIESAAGWAPGSFEAAQQGKTPTPASLRDHAQTSSSEIAARFDFLLRAVPPKEDGEHSSEEISDALKQNGIDVSPTYIHQIHTGEIDDVSDRVLTGLARYFGVPESYFTDSSVTADVEKELSFLTALRDSTIKNIALRAAGLSQNSLGPITEMIEAARRIEGLPPVNEDGT